MSILEEKIKLYLDIWVGSKAGHNMLDVAKRVLFIDMGMDTRYEQELLALDKRIEIATFILSRLVSDEDIDKELLNLPQGDVKNANEFIKEYWHQIRLAKEAEHAGKH